MFNTLKAPFVRFKAACRAWGKRYGPKRKRPQNRCGELRLISIYQGRPGGGNAHQRRIHWRHEWSDGMVLRLIESRGLWVSHRYGAFQRFTHPGTTLDEVAAALTTLEGG